MVARDDSVIRGSLITCMIFLVLSIALNFFLWWRADTASQTEERAKQDMSQMAGEVRTKENQILRMKAMLGVGGFTEAEIEEMKQNASEDADMQQIEEQYTTDMAYFGPEVEPQNRNYPGLPTYLVNAIRKRNESVRLGRDEVSKAQTDKTSAVDNARNAQQLAEDQLAVAKKQAEDQRTEFNEDRSRMNLEKEQTRDQLTSTVQDFDKFRRVASAEKNQLSKKAKELQGTIDTQKLQLNDLRSENFESTQGEIRYVVAGGNVVTINLGSSDALRPGVTFGVIDGDETRLQDAKVKATIQVTQVQGPHLAQARVVARPEIRNPIIPGDMIFSPFWAPGREVKIALAGDIDIDGDGRPDNEAIKGQIRAAGAVVAAEISSTGAVSGKLDPSIRFLVVGDDPEIEGDDAAAERNADVVQLMGNVKSRAGELGLTIIPVWKLQAYLKTINDSLTTPLGSAARGSDFEPESSVGTRRLPNDRADIFDRQTEGMQQGNNLSDILAP